MPLVDGCVEHLEQLVDPQPGIAAVGVGALGDQGGEDVSGFENAGIVREQAEHKTHEEPLQVVPFIPGGFQGVMELAHHLGRQDIHRVLVAERPLPNAENEAELLYIARAGREGETGLRCHPRGRIARRSGNRSPAGSGEARVP